MNTAPTTNLLSIARRQVSVRWMSNSSVDLPFRYAHWLSVTSASLSERTCFAIMSATHDSKILLGHLARRGDNNYSFPQDHLF